MHLAESWQTPRPLPSTGLQFGFARRISVGGRSGRPAQQQGSRDALFPQPAPLATDDTPLALGQVCRPLLSQQIIGSQQSA